MNREPGNLPVFAYCAFERKGRGREAVYWVKINTS
jgi:hypothetical protein